MAKFIVHHAQTDDVFDGVGASIIRATTIVLTAALGLLTVAATF